MPLMKRHCNVWLTNRKSDTLKCTFMSFVARIRKKQFFIWGKCIFTQYHQSVWPTKRCWMSIQNVVVNYWRTHLTTVVAFHMVCITKVFISLWTNQFHLDEKEWAKFDETDRAVYLEIYLFCCNHTKINCCPDSTWSWSALIISAPSMYVMVLTLAVIMASCFIQLCQFRYCERK